MCEGMGKGIVYAVLSDEYDYLGLDFFFVFCFFWFFLLNVLSLIFLWLSRVGAPYLKHTINFLTLRDETVESSKPSVEEVLAMSLFGWSLHIGIL